MIEVLPIVPICTLGSSFWNSGARVVALRQYPPFSVRSVDPSRREPPRRPLSYSDEIYDDEISDMVLKTIALFK